MRKFKNFICKIIRAIANMMLTKKGYISITKSVLHRREQFGSYGFNCMGLDIDNKNIEYYKKELQEIYKRQKIWQTNAKYDVKVYASRRTMETIFILVLKHNYGSDFFNHLEQRSLCNYVNTIYEEKLLQWTPRRFYEICESKQYMNNIIHPYQYAFNDYKNIQLKNSISKLINEFKKSIGFVREEKVYSDKKIEKKVA